MKHVCVPACAQIFTLDMVLQFCVVYQKTAEKGDDVRFISERQKIIRHYFLGWFPLDLFSILPSIFDIVPLVEASYNEEGNAMNAEASEKLSGFRMIRALRLVKLVRLIRASRLLARWQARIGLSFGATTLLRIVVMMALVCHWYACVFALQAVLHDDPYSTWLGLQGHCSSVPLVLEGANANLTISEVFEKQCEGFDLPTFYLAAFSWSAMIITGLGGTDWYPSQDNAETAIVTALVVFGAIMWAKVLATFCDLATNSDPSAVEYRQAIDDLNRFCNSQGLDSKLKRRLRQYFAQRKHIMMAKSASGVIHKMSTSLQIEVVMLVHNHWLKNIWFLRGAEDPCLVQLALRMEACVFAPSELPDPENLYILHRGIVMVGGRVLTSGKMWGEELILDDEHFRPNPARCMTYVEVYSISRLVFFKVTNSFDEARRLVRKGACKILVQRGVIKLVRKLRKQKRHGDHRGFLEMILDAAETADGHIATVGSVGGDTVSLQLMDDVKETKNTVESVALQMDAMRLALNALLQKQGLDPIPTPRLTGEQQRAAKRQKQKTSNPSKDASFKASPE